MRMSALVTTYVIIATTAQAAGDTGAELKEQVRQAEVAFAKSMADRDHAAFTALLADDTVFAFPGGPLRGKRQVSEAWSRFFQGPQAPFSWEPQLVEVLDSGALAMTSGPVRDPSGKPMGSFHSIWRREADGRWRVVFDNGSAPCNCATPAAAPAASPSARPSP
jgi:uncharacterized protein (TIGR02246 family)